MFRQAKSNAKAEAYVPSPLSSCFSSLTLSFLYFFFGRSCSGPPRDKSGTARYAQHLPFQAFCCESGSHIVDPFQSYYKGITYRASTVAQNISISAGATPEWDPETQCMDSTQMWFCRDLWVDAARGGLKSAGGRGRGGMMDDEDEEGGAGGEEGSPHQARVGKKAKGKVVVKRNVEEFVKRQEEIEEKKEVEDVVAPRQPDEAVPAQEVETEDEDEDAKAAENAPDLPPVVEEPALDSAPIADVPQPAGAADANAEAAAEDDDGPVFNKQPSKQEDDHDHAGSAADAMVEDDSDAPLAPPAIDSSSTIPPEFLIPNSAFKPARIVVNPRCVTTYGGVSHTALAQDLFGSGNEWNREEWDDEDLIEKYAITEWQGPPDSFVCQEMRTTGGRVAPKSQRRVGFLLQNVRSPSAFLLRVTLADIARRLSPTGGWSGLRCDLRQRNARLAFFLPHAPPSPLSVFLQGV